MVTSEGSRVNVVGNRANPAGLSVSSLIHSRARQSQQPAINSHQVASVSREHGTDRHDPDQDLCRRSAVPHDRRRSAAVLPTVRRHRRSGCHHRSTDQQEPWIRIRKRYKMAYIIARRKCICYSPVSVSVCLSVTNHAFEIRTTLHDSLGTLYFMTTKILGEIPLGTPQNRNAGNKFALDRKIYF